MLDQQFQELVNELMSYVDLKLILYWMAGLFGIVMNWFKMWINNEISCGLFVWLSDNKKSTFTSLTAFLASGFALVGLGGFEQMTYIIAMGAGYAAATTSETYLNRVDRKYYTGENVGLVQGLKSLSDTDAPVQTQ